MADSIFTKIIKGEIPCHKVYEDDKTLAFLDINPTTPGHTLVISKKQIDHLWDLPDEDYQAVMMACKKIANKLREVLQVQRVGVKVMGEEVAHAHVHLIPFNKIEEFYGRRPQIAEPKNQELAEMAKKLAP